MVRKLVILVFIISALARQNELCFLAAFTGVVVNFKDLNYKGLLGLFFVTFMSFIVGVFRGTPNMLQDVLYLVTPLLVLVWGRSSRIDEARFGLHTSAVLIGILGSVATVFAASSLTMALSVFEFRQIVFKPDYAAPLVFWLILKTKSRRELSVFWYVILLLILAHVVVSLSRSHIFYLILFSPLCLDWRRVVVLCSVAVGLMVSGLSINEDFAAKIANSSHEVFSLEESNFQTTADINRAYRAFEFAEALNQFAEFGFLEKVFGAGAGQHVTLGENVRLRGSLYAEVPITHIALGSILVKFGLLGLFVHLWFLILSVVARPRGIGLGEASILTGSLVYGFMFIQGWFSINLCLFVLLISFYYGPNYALYPGSASGI